MEDTVKGGGSACSKCSTSNTLNECCEQRSCLCEKGKCSRRAGEGCTERKRKGCRNRELREQKSETVREKRRRRKLNRGKEGGRNVLN